VQPLDSLSELPAGTIVRLVRSIPDHHLESGQRGVLAESDGPPYLVHFTAADGALISTTISDDDLLLVGLAGDAPIEDYRTHLHSLSGQWLEHLSTHFGDEPGRKPAAWHGILPGVHAFGELSDRLPVWYGYCAPPSSKLPGIAFVRHSDSIAYGEAAGNAFLVAEANRRRA
jgi:hypothetical protein